LETTDHISLRISQIDAVSFETLYNTYWKKMFSICYRSTKDEELSKEIVQEVFKSIWERRASLQIEGPAGHYLVKAVKLKMLERYRSQTKQREHLSAVGYLQQQAENTTADQVLFNEQFRLFTSGIEELPEKCRTIYRLSQQSTLTPAQIAVGLNISSKTVENYLSQASQLLRRKIGHRNK
jgi:RNA polymerase sigma-70 factor (ECF subfamily)